jgi:hypothetical protein
MSDSSVDRKNAAVAERWNPHLNQRETALRFHLFLANSFR